MGTGISIRNANPLLNHQFITVSHCIISVKRGRDGTKCALHIYANPSHNLRK